MFLIFHIKHIYGPSSIWSGWLWINRGYFFSFLKWDAEQQTSYKIVWMTLQKTHLEQISRMTIATFQNWETPKAVERFAFPFKFCIIRKNSNNIMILFMFILYVNKNQYNLPLKNILVIPNWLYTGLLLSCFARSFLHVQSREDEKITTIPYPFPSLSIFHSVSIYLAENFLHHIQCYLIYE